MLADRNIIILSSIEWDAMWQAHQVIASRLASAGNRVLFVENLGTRSPRLADAGRVISRVGNVIRALPSAGSREVRKNLFVASHVVLPPYGGGLRRRVNQRIFLPAILRTARSLGVTAEPVIWSFLPSDTALDLASELRSDGSVLVYYLADNLELIARDPARLRTSEREMIAEADLVFATNSQLTARHSDLLNDAPLYPPGVDLSAFPASAISEPACPDELRETPRPIIGFVGSISRHVDVPLVAELVRRRRDWSWVFIGSVQTDLGNLVHEPNFRLLGPKPHSKLVHYIAQFTVGVVPYREAPYTRTVLPTKINEYLAAGCPVVSTDLPPVAAQNHWDRVVLRSPATANSFEACIERAIVEPRDSATVERRRAVAAAASWERQLTAMTSDIERVLQLRRPPPGEAASGTVHP